MKSTFIILALTFVTLVSFYSCKKKYRCVCNGGLVVNQYEQKLSKATAEIEKSRCQLADSTCVFERDKK